MTIDAVRKFKLRTRAAADARAVLENHSERIEPASDLTDEEDEYVRKYFRALAKKMRPSIFIDDAELE